MKTSELEHLIRTSKEPIKQISLFLESRLKEILQENDLPLSSEINPKNLQFFERFSNLETTIKIAKRINVSPALHVAAICDRVDVMELLINERGVDVNILDNNNYTALHFAACANNQESLQFLIFKGADLNIVYDDCNTTLSDAAYYGNFEAVSILINAGANVVGDSKPLHEAVEGYEDFRIDLEGRLKTINILIDAGVCLNARDQYDRTPLENAISGGCLEIAQLLYNRSGYEKIEQLLYDEEHTLIQWNILDRAISEGHLGIMQWLLSMVENMDDKEGLKVLAFHNASNMYNEYVNNDLELQDYYKSKNRERIEILKWLVQDGVLIDNIDEHGRTALFKVAEYKNLNAVERLINLEANIHCIDSSGNTPLHVASRYDHYLYGNDHVDERKFDREDTIKIMKFLIEKGANVYTQNAATYTPLDEAFNGWNHLITSPGINNIHNYPHFLEAELYLLCCTDNSRIHEDFVNSGLVQFAIECKNDILGFLQRASNHEQILINDKKTIGIYQKLTGTLQDKLCEVAAVDNKTATDLYIRSKLLYILHIAEHTDHPVFGELGIVSKIAEYFDFGDGASLADLFEQYQQQHVQALGDDVHHEG
ncbi:MAG: ankyrin repeat domain-containing protein [Rickettsiaceae bacterium]|nr:ankyrin repeat domain-containing protein [Rickettsiaceae bacterium]